MAIVAFDTKSVRTSAADWRAIVKSAIRDPEQLLKKLEFPDEAIRGMLLETASAQRQFTTFVPSPFLNRIRPSDANDPLLRQVLPVIDESKSVPGFSADAVGDQFATLTNGLIHKYQGRVLLITRGVCAVHCRYCFRRHFPYDTAPVSIQQFDEALQVVREDRSIHEVILSGGDPLMMVDEKLRELVSLIESIPHVTRLRIHTRLPVVIPQRVNSELLSLLNDCRLTKIVVLHVNHANEIDDGVREAAANLLQSGSMLLNQSVLLRDINDNPDALVELSEQLIGMNCIPYYLHQLDRVQGTAHFEVLQERGKELIAEIRKRLPGFAVPRYVCEIPGEPSKTVIA